MRALYLAAAAVAAITAPAGACLPPAIQQTETERLRPAFDASTDIVYGVVTRGARAGQLAHFRVIHVYKGNLAPGAVIRAVPTDGFDPPPCLGMMQMPPPRAYEGQYGVIAFHAGSPALNFMTQYSLELMFREGWIVSAGR